MRFLMFILILTPSVAVSVYVLLGMWLYAIHAIPSRSLRRPGFKAYWRTSPSVYKCKRYWVLRIYMILAWPWIDWDVVWDKGRLNLDFIEWEIV